MKKMPISILLISCLIFISHAQSNFSVELGPSYVFNLSYKGDQQNLQNARGINLGFNYQLNQKTLLNLNFGYQKFLYEQQTYVFAPKAAMVYDILYPIINGENISFYNISLSFRAYLSEKGLKPFISFGSGIHFIKGGKYFKDEREIVYPNYNIVPSSHNSETSMRFYFLFGPGLSIPVINKFDALVSTSVSVSTEIKYIFVPLNILLKYNF